ncbi:MAG: undecaprenyl-diphosphate phosphatase [Defluviitaleaceae bacterium]|nr:undecaprenyl-diphosphate phosphatase [Defluviitaleaceae bacterium]
MNILHAVILGIVQGFAEFLPISSSGHLVLLQSIFGISQPMMTFDVVLHLGSLVAVFVALWPDIWKILRHPIQKMTGLLIVATIPAVIVGALFQHRLEDLFSSGYLLAVAFIITGIFLIIADRLRRGYKKDKDITWLDAILIGCMQAVGIPPGISRSGSTITGALARKLDRETAARFSFLMSIPAILGAGVLTLKDIWFPKAGAAPEAAVGALPMIFGFVAAALTGYISIKFMLEIIKRCKLRYFSIYVFIVAAFVIITTATGIFSK